MSLLPSFFQKQYIFVYRAIMEMAQFGDTEMESTEIKSVSRRLCGSPSPLSPKGGSSSVSSNSSSSEGTGELAQEFAKLANIVDDRKALSVGKSKKAVCLPEVPVRNFVHILWILALGSYRQP